MKKIFTLCVFTAVALVTRSQAVLNEIYPQPGNGYNEFFELYNESNTLEYLDNYTIVTFYEEAGKTGFYIMDLPNDSILPHGYYTGASANPYNIQSQSGLTANFNWNAMPAGGSLTKWERNGSTYTQVPVPANLNDFFVRIVGGSEGVYHSFVYKNGILVNGVVGGINTTTIPPSVKTMPSLPVNMSGSSPDFTINFGTIPDNSVEFIPNSLGTNNGYYRSSDGLCGEWLKSDQPGQHNPNSTNGMALSLTPANQLAIGAVISQYAMEPGKALLTYNITSAPSFAFPVTVEVYTDLGIAGQLDLNDVLTDTRPILSAAAGPQSIVLPSWDVAVIIVVKAATDCYNRTVAVGNYWSVLPVNLVSFQGNLDRNNKTTLQWKVENNETVDQFEIERSLDGKEFVPVGVVFASEKNASEEYLFYQTVSNFDKVMYRLKMTDRKNDVSYSRTLVFQSKTITNNTIKVLGNPLTDKLTFSYNTVVPQVINIKIYDMAGKLMMLRKINSAEGENLVSLPLSSGYNPGMYLLEVNNGTQNHTVKFVKH